MPPKRPRFPPPPQISAPNIVSALDATIKVLLQNDKRRAIPPVEQDAVSSLCSIVQLSTKDIIGPDLVIKAFADLDTIFFGSRLRGNILLSWVSDGIHFPLGPVQRSRILGRHYDSAGERGQCHPY